MDANSLGLIRARNYSDSRKSSLSAFCIHILPKCWISFAME